MLTTQKHPKVKFFCAFIYADGKIYNTVKKTLVKKFGPIDFESDEIPFNFTKYYEPEMGLNLTRRFLSFTKLQKPDIFPDIKLFTIKLEKKFAKNNNRVINIDPGYLTQAKLILTTTKDFSHRIYIGKGLFAEITLHYQNNNFQYLPTTFPDYRTDEYKNIFLRLRKTYRLQINEK